MLGNSCQKATAIVSREFTIGSHPRLCQHERYFQSLHSQESQDAFVFKIQIQRSQQGLSI